MRGERFEIHLLEVSDGSWRGERCEVSGCEVRGGRGEVGGER